MNLTVARWVRPGFDEPTRGILMPLVDGKPTGKKWYMTFRAGDPDRPYQLHARKRFTFEAPEKPGIYNVMATAWPDPYQPAYEGLPDQKEKNTDVIQETYGLSSNIVRVEVVGKD